jgi:hypothetical protein
MVLVGYVLLSYICFSLLSSFLLLNVDPIIPLIPSSISTLSLCPFFHPKILWRSFGQDVFAGFRSKRDHPVKNDLAICPTIDFLRPTHISVSPTLKEICLLLTESIEGVKSDIFLGRLLQNHLHRFVIIPLDFEIRDPCIALGGFDSGVSQQILDGDKVRISIEQLGSHGMAKIGRTTRS